MLKLCAGCIEVNFIAFLKVTHLLYSLSLICEHVIFCSEEDQKNGRKRLAFNKNDICFKNFVCCCNIADKIKLFAEDLIFR